MRATRGVGHWSATVNAFLSESKLTRVTRDTSYDLKLPLIIGRPLTCLVERWLDTVCPANDFNDFYRTRSLHSHALHTVISLSMQLHKPLTLSDATRRDDYRDLRRAQRVEKWNGTTRHAHDRVRWSTDARLPIPRVTAANIARKTSAALLANRMDPRRYEAPVYMQLDDTLLSASDQAGRTAGIFLVRSFKSRTTESSECSNIAIL